MSLIFEYHEITDRQKALTFDDCLLVPQYTEVSSRKDPSLRSRLTKKWSLDLPIVSSNMDTITELPMAHAMALLGGVGILHRFLSIEDQAAQALELRERFTKEGIKSPVAASIGVKEEGQKRAHALAEAGVDIITLDIAHGDSIMMIETLRYVKKAFPHIEVIAGNVASPDAVRRLANEGADAVKVGIGPGSMCTTRIITGHGVPQLTAIAWCANEAERLDIPLIADGGIRNSGDMVKAYCAGADTIMLGSMLSGTLETPGEVKGGRKQYRGMASKKAQVSWRGDLPQGMAPEGEATFVTCKGSVKDVLHEVSGGIRSGMTYLGVREISQMRKAARFMEMGQAGLSESRPHGVNS